MREREQREAAADSQHRQNPRGSRIQPEGRQQRRQRDDIRRALRCLQRRQPRRRDQALQRHLRGDAQRHDDDEGAQVSAPKQHQRARGAAVRQHHAVTEQQAAKEHQRRGKARLQIDRFVEIHVVAEYKKLRRQHCDADGQRVGAHQPAVTLAPPAAKAAQKTEAAEQADCAEDKADQETGINDDVGTE